MTRETVVSAKICGKRLAMIRERSLLLLGLAGRPLASVPAFWFAWAAFHPQTELPQ